MTWGVKGPNPLPEALFRPVIHDATNSTDLYRHQLWHRNIFTATQQQRGTKSARISVHKYHCITAGRENLAPSLVWLSSVLRSRISPLGAAREHEHLFWLCHSPPPSSILSTLSKKFRRICYPACRLVRILSETSSQVRGGRQTQSFMVPES